MALVRSVSALVIEAIAKDNPDLPYVPTVNNCIAYDFSYIDSVKATCQIKAVFGTGLRGRHRVRYNKLDVDILTQAVNRELPRTVGTNTLSYLGIINSRYGLNLKPEEVINLPVMDSGNTCRLTIRPESLIFCGTVDLQIRTPLPGISEAILQRQLDPVFNTWNIGAEIPGFLLTRGHDYSAVAGILTTLSSGTLDSQTTSTLATALKSVDTVPWGVVPDTLYSLSNADVIYNGAVADMPALYAINNSGRYENVLVLMPDGETGLTAPLVINYNIYSDLRS